MFKGTVQELTWLIQESPKWLSGVRESQRMVSCRRWIWKESMSRFKGNVCQAKKFRLLPESNVEAWKKFNQICV